MRKQIFSIVMALILCLSLFAATPVSAGQNLQGKQPPEGAVKPAPEVKITQLIVKFKPESQISVNLKQIADALQPEASVDRGTEEIRNVEEYIGQSAGVAVQYFRPMSGDGHVFKLDKGYSLEEAQAIAGRVAENGDVEYAEPDLPMHADVSPTDSFYIYGYLWGMMAATPSNYGMDLPTAWNYSTGDYNLRVAVIDTGILKGHPDLYGRWVGGYDFITDPWTANDGNGRDADPSDAGDWSTWDDYYNIMNCGYPSDSSWHGSHVAGTIGAAANNGTGVVGVNFSSKILPVRVLGKCGGFTSDIVDGLRWAAGIAVAGVPANPYPAKVLNFSLGGGYSCNTTWQSAINEAKARGAIVVVAAGNAGDDAQYYTPAGCANVITVGATEMLGRDASYSNYGSTVEIWAPGGDSSNPVAGRLDNLIFSSVSTSPTSPNLGGYTWKGYQGTSMATPHIAGLVSLMLSKNPALTYEQIVSVLQNTSTPLNPSSGCGYGWYPCGPAGVANAGRAMAAISTPAVHRSADFDGDGRDELMLCQEALPGYQGGNCQVMEDANAGYAYGPWVTMAWPAYNSAGRGAVSTSGDFDGDSLAEVLLCQDDFPGSQGGYCIVNDDGAHGYAPLKWLAFGWPAYQSAGLGVVPASGDLDGDGRDEVVLCQKNYSAVADGGYCQVMDDANTGYAYGTWLSFAWPNYKLAGKGVRPSIGDYDGDGLSEVAMCMYYYGTDGGYCQLYDDAAHAYAPGAWVRISWPAYQATGKGIQPASGDFDGDGRAELLMCQEEWAGTTGGFCQVMEDASSGFAPSTWLSFAWPAYQGTGKGVRPSAGDYDGDGKSEILLCTEDYTAGQGGYCQTYNDAVSGYAPGTWIAFGWPAYNATGRGVLPIQR